VITSVVHGWRPSGLIAYLMGPGRYEEHRNPRVIASWDGAPQWHQPPKLLAVEVGGERVEPGEFDFDLRGLIDTMQAMPKNAGLPLDNPPPEPVAGAMPGSPDGGSAEEVSAWSAWLRTAGRRHPPGDAPEWVRLYRWDPKANRIRLRQGYVWHCSVALHPDDPVLTDEVWQRIAHRLMEATGIHQAGCRWIAIRHADNHIHLMATLVSETTGRRFHPRNDYPKLRAAAQALEAELGLVSTASMDKTARREPSRQEIGKADRTGRVDPARVELRRLVSQLAATTHTPAAFLAALRAEGLVVHLQRGADGAIRGYAVGLHADRTASGAPVLYAGGKLAADLTWPKLLARWTSTPHRDVPALAHTSTGQPTPDARRAVLADATAVIQRASAQLRSERMDGDGITHATGEVIAALTAATEPRQPGPLAAVLDHYDRCARTPNDVLPRSLGPLARDLRWTARHLARVGVLSGRGNERYATAALLVALAALIAEIGAWHQLHGRRHQAAAAHRASSALPTGLPTALSTAPARHAGSAAVTTSRSAAERTTTHKVAPRGRPPAATRPTRPHRTR
jgi:hypothetical protein